MHHHPLPPLPPSDAARFDRLADLHGCLHTLAVADRIPLSDFVAWTSLPHIAPWIDALNDILTHSARQAAIRAAIAALNAPQLTPAQALRLTTTLLRLLNPPRHRAKPAAPTPPRPASRPAPPPGTHASMPPASMPSPAPLSPRQPPGQPRAQEASNPGPPAREPEAPPAQGSVQATPTPATPTRPSGSPQGQRSSDQPVTGQPAPAPPDAASAPTPSARPAPTPSLADP